MSESVFHPPSPDVMSQLLPSLEFIGMLSSNSVGAVYYASQKSLDRDVAVKIFCPNLSSEEHFRSHFVGSTTSMAGLRHPNLIGVYDSGVVEGMSYVVIEFVPGKSLWRSTMGHAIEFSQAMSLIGEIGDGMAYAHARKITHGYLSPLDILLNQNASPKIGNFGLGLTVHTLPDVVVPTHFSAPEVLAGDEPTEASDLYSLAAIFYELITGNPYQPGGPRASELEGTPKAIDEVIERAGASDPQRRDMDPAEFCQLLQKASQRKVVAPAAPVRRPPVAPVMMAAGQKEETKLLTKIVIILVLLIAIQQVWSHRDMVLSRRSAQDKGADAEEVQAIQETPRQRIKQPLTPSRPAPQSPESDSDPAGFPEAAETPMESLERLRNALHRGSRSEMPAGTLQHGDSHYFLVTREMSWGEAVAFAEQHGGHLALPAADMSWRDQEPLRNHDLWLGAARGGADDFTLLDGRPWSPASIAGNHPYVHLRPSGAYGTAGATTAKHFVIQWRADGSQPASLEAQLAATAASLKGSRPIFPPGTLATEGGRHYLPVVRPTRWQEARALAESAGGSLAVLSHDDELTLLQKAAAIRPDCREFWLGGHLSGDNWQWVSPEPWRAIPWLSRDNAAGEDAAMLLRPGSGLDAKPSSESTAGLLIEWSRDPETNKRSAEVGPSAAAALAELLGKAGQLVVDAERTKEEAHAKNTDKVAWDLDAHMRGLNRSAQQALAPEVDKLKGCVRGKRLLKETIEEEGVALSPFMAKLCNYVISKQAEIDEQHATSLRVIHASYRAKLGEIRDQAGAAGQIRTQLQAEGLLEESGNMDAWVSAMRAAAGG